MIEPAAPRRPVLRYHGGKWRIAPWIISHFPEHKSYCEPFGGAGSVLLQKPRCGNEVYNEIDDDIVNLFRVLRDPYQTKALCSLLEYTPFSRAEFEAAYEHTDQPLERARRTVIRSFQSFGSAGTNPKYVTGFRAASKQSGRPPGLDWANIPDSLWLVTERLKGVIIENRFALGVIKQQDCTNTLFYCDPPYYTDTRPNSNCLQYRHELTPLAHRRLLETLKTVRGKVVLSGYRSELYDTLLAGWHRVEKQCQASGQTGSVERTEVLWMNFQPPATPLHPTGPPIAKRDTPSRISD